MVIAFVFEQIIRNLLRFHAFGNRSDSHLVGHGNYRLHDFGIRRAFFDVGYKRPIDLQGIDG